MSEERPSQLRARAVSLKWRAKNLVEVAEALVAKAAERDLEDYKVCLDRGPCPHRCEDVCAEDGRCGRAYLYQGTEAYYYHKPLPAVRRANLNQPPTWGRAKGEPEGEGEPWPPMDSPNQQPEEDPEDGPFEPEGEGVCEPVGPSVSDLDVFHAATELYQANLKHYGKASFLDCVKTVKEGAALLGPNRTQYEETTEGLTAPSRIFGDQGGPASAGGQGDKPGPHPAPLPPHSEMG